MAVTGRGLEISGDGDAVAVIDAFTDRLARISLGVEEILPVADQRPDVPMLQLSAAMLWLYAQTEAGSRSARAYLDRAAALEPTMNDRERLLLAALRHWQANRFQAGVETFEALTRRWPTDLAAVKALEFLYYVLGQQHNGPRFLAHIESIAAPNAEDPDFLAVWGFAAELSDDRPQATERIEHALDIEANVPWAHHALAHLLIGQGDGPDALRRLTNYLPLWEGDGRVIHCHNAWHLALVHLDQLDVDRALGIYRDHVWDVVPDSPGEQIDAASLLWRIEMGGWSVDDALWADLADHVEARVHECFMPFLSAHHAYALARAERHDALDTLLGVVAARTAADDDEAVRVWQPVGRAVVLAAAAHGHGDLARSAELLGPVMAQMPIIGGSDAQDDLFRQSYLTSLIGMGRTAEARTYWHAITDWKTPSLLDERWRSQL